MKWLARQAAIYRARFPVRSCSWGIGLFGLICMLALFMICFDIVSAFAQAAPIGAPATQNTVTTTGAVTSDTTISVGTFAGQVLTWLTAAFGLPIGALITAVLLRAFKWLGVQVTTAMRDQLQSVVVNGLNAAAKNATTQLAGQGQVNLKNQIVADAVKYTQAHGAETIKALGLDPQSGAAVEAIKARIETAIVDPMTPTPAVLDPPAAVAPAK